MLNKQFQDVKPTFSKMSGLIVTCFWSIFLYIGIGLNTKFNKNKTLQNISVALFLIICLVFPTNQWC